jgi:monoamine oxidase
MFFASTESSYHEGGYLGGAIQAALNTVQAIKMIDPEG